MNKKNYQKIKEIMEKAITIRLSNLESHPDAVLANDYIIFSTYANFLSSEKLEKSTKTLETLTAILAALTAILAFLAVRG